MYARAELERDDSSVSCWASVPLFSYIKMIEEKGGGGLFISKPDDLKDLLDICLPIVGFERFLPMFESRNLLDYHIRYQGC